MTTLKKTVKSQIISDDLNDFSSDSSSCDFQFFNDPPKNKIPQKRLRTETLNTDISSNVGPTSSTVCKKKKTNEEIEMCGDARQTILNVLGHHLNSRKQINENLMKCLPVVLKDFEADYNALEENKQNLKHLTASYMEFLKQATVGHKQKLGALKEIHITYKKECEEMEADLNAEMNKFGDELEEDIVKLKQKLISEMKRSGWKKIRRTFMKAMQNNI